MSGHMVNFNAKHALQNYRMFLTRTDNPEQVKVYACSCRAMRKNGKWSYVYNEPGSQLWAYIVTNDFDVMKVKEAHVREAVQESGFKEVTPEFLQEIGNQKEYTMLIRFSPNEVVK